MATATARHTEAIAAARQQLAQHLRSARREYPDYIGDIAEAHYNFRLDLESGSQTYAQRCAYFTGRGWQADIERLVAERDGAAAGYYNPRTGIWRTDEELRWDACSI